jgi:hypothetical protein
MLDTATKSFFFEGLRATMGSCFSPLLSGSAEGEVSYQEGEESRVVWTACYNHPKLGTSALTMSSEIDYSPKRDDLYSPGKNARFFDGGPPRSEAMLCAEMARLVYCRSGSTFAFDEERIGAVLKCVGFTNYQFFETGRTHCLLAQGVEGLGVIAFRGTDVNDPTDLGDDADLLLSPWKQGGRVHRGFANAFTEVRVDVEYALRRITDRVLFTGHSLGAAMATLLASVRKPDSLYTFGSPKVGDADFVASLKAVPNQRYVDCCDLVARMPPDVFGFAHLGNAHYIDSNRRVTFNPTAEMVDIDQITAREKYLVEYAWKDGNVAVRDLADHAPINYVLPLSAEQS